MKHALGLLACTTLVAQEPLVSGPASGTPLPKAVVYVPTGPGAGSEFDLATVIGTAPGALLFVHEVTRNTAPVIRGFDELGLELRLLGLRAFAVRLSADRSEGETSSARQSQALGMHSPMVVSVDGAEGPGGYALNRRCTLTLVTCKDGKIRAAHAFTDVGRQDLPALRAALEAVAGKLPEDEGALRKLLAASLPKDAEALRTLTTELAVALARKSKAPESRPTSRMRQEAPADDQELTNLARRVIQPNADSAALDRAFAAIDARVGDDPKLHVRALEIFRNVVKLGYGTEEARKRAQAWIDAHAK